MIPLSGQQHDSTEGAV